MRILTGGVVAALVAMGLAGEADTLRTAAGQSHQVLVRTWLVPRGTFLFLIGMSGAAEGTDVADSEFAGALRSIVIEK